MFAPAGIKTLSSLWMLNSKVCSDCWESVPLQNLPRRLAWLYCDLLCQDIKSAWAFCGTVNASTATLLDVWTIRMFCIQHINQLEKRSIRRRSLGLELETRNSACNQKTCFFPTEVPQDEVKSAVNCSQVSIAPARTYCNYMVRDAARRQLCGADSKTYFHHGLKRSGPYGSNCQTSKVVYRSYMKPYPNYDPYPNSIKQC